MKTSIWIVLSVSLIGDILVFVSSTFLLMRKNIVNWLAKYATPFAAGALLAAAFLDFLHDGVENYEPITILTAAMVGLIFFFLLEGWLHWFHHHSQEAFETDKAHADKTEPVAFLAVTGNWLHNFIDGAAIAAAFLINYRTGIVTTIAVALHEIPREMADSGYLLKRGMSRLKVIGVHGVAIIFTIAGTLLFYLTGRANSTLLAWLIGSTAGFFIYIAASDIIPSINRSRQKPSLLEWQSTLVVLGAASVGTVVVVAHSFIG